MRWLSALKFIFFLFCVVTTAQVLAITIVFLFTNLSVPSETTRFWVKILGLSCVTSLPVFVLVSNETATPLEALIRKVIHFILTTGGLLVLLLNYRWLHRTNAIIILITYVIVYVIAMIVWELQTKRITDKLNKRIQERLSSRNSIE